MVKIQGRNGKRWVTIPKDVIQQLGWETGDNVYVVAEREKIIIEKMKKQ